MVTKDTPKRRTAAAIARDPLDLNWRLYQQLGRLLDDMEAADREEKMTMPQRIAAMVAIGRVQKMFVDLRKGDIGAGAGSAIDKYSAAFAPTHATSGRNQTSGPASNALQFNSSSDAEPDDDDFDGYAA